MFAGRRPPYMWEQVILVFISTLILVAGQTNLLAQARSVANSPVRMVMSPLVTRARSHAPLPVTISLFNRETGLIRGQLNLKITVLERLKYRIQIPELALGIGETKVRILLPEVNVDQSDFAVRATAELDTGDFTYYLGEHDIVIPIDQQRDSVLLSVISSEKLPDRSQLDLQDSLYLHRFAPRLPNRSETRRPQLVTVGSTLDPREIPTSSLQLLCADVLLLYRRELDELKESQLNAILEWVRAGGSLCVVLEYRNPNNTSIEFLNQLVSSTPESPDFAREVDGMLYVRNRSQDGYRLLEPGIGRAVIVDDLETVGNWLTSQNWTRACCFLWRVRHDTQESLIPDPDSDVAYNQWTPPERTKISRDNWSLDGGEYSPEPPAGKQKLLYEGMVPVRDKAVPIGAFFAIILGFLGLISVGDYYLLGWLRLRKLTWLILPMVSLGFTWLTITIAERSLGETEAASTYELIDIGNDGKPVRVSRFDYSLVATPTTRTQDFIHTHHVNLDQIRARESDFSPSRRRGSYSEAALAATDNEQSIPWIIGRPPSEYSVNTVRKQWSYQFTRDTTLHKVEDSSGIPWLELARLDWSTEEGSRQVAERILAEQPKAEIRILNGHQPENDSYRFLPSESTAMRFAIGVSEYRGNTGLFKVLSGVGPTGHSNLEDLLMLDSSNPFESLLIVAIPHGSQYTTYRFRQRRSK